MNITDAKKNTKLPCLKKIGEFSFYSKNAQNILWKNLSKGLPLGGGSCVAGGEG